MKIYSRIFYTFLFVCYFVSSYTLIARWVENRGVFYPVFLFPFEEQIPFVPATVLIYCGIYLLPVAAFFLINHGLKKIIFAFLFTMIVHDIIWILYPVRMDLRPSLVPYAHHVLYPLMNLLYTLDTPPVNCFPSLHVSYAFLTYYSLKAFSPRWENFSGVWAVLIALSTLTFKQHYVVDVFSGWLLAWCASQLFYARKKNVIADDTSVTV